MYATRRRIVEESAVEYAAREAIANDLEETTSLWNH